MKDVACYDRTAVLPVLVVSSTGTCCPQATAVQRAAVAFSLFLIRLFSGPAFSSALSREHITEPALTQ